MNAKLQRTHTEALEEKQRLFAALRSFDDDQKIDTAIFYDILDVNHHGNLTAFLLTKVSKGTCPPEAISNARWKCDFANRFKSMLNESWSVE